MIRSTLFAAALAMAAAPLASAQESEQRWFADYDKAVEVAKAEGKDLMVDFTGSDWCYWCKKLDEEVFSHDSWYTAASEKFVLVALDFPNSDEAKAAVPNPARNQELVAKYQVGGYPTILLMTADGEVFAQTGYQEGGPESYLSHMSTIASSGKKLLAAAKVIESEYASAKDKTVVVRKAVKMLMEAEAGAPGLGVLAKVARKGFTLDPENKSGLKKEALAGLLSSGQAEKAEFALAMEMDPKNAEGLYEQAIVAQGRGVNDEVTAGAFVEALLKLKSFEMVHDKETVGSLTLSAGMWCHSEEMLNRPEDAKVLLKWANELGQMPEELKKELGDIL
jgi:thioredoxin-related protein